MSVLRWIWSLVMAEPVRAQSLFQAGVVLAAAFGLNLTGAQMGALAAFNAMLLGFLTRQAVTPNPVVAAQVHAALMTEPPQPPQP